MIIVERSRHESSSRLPRCDSATVGGGLIVEAVLAAAISLSQKTVLHDAAPAPISAVNDPKQRGYQPSAYKGNKYRQSQERLRRCIGQREGRFFYGGTGSNGLYQSTYQMTVPLLRGAAWMMRPELVANYGKQGVHIFNTLLHTPGHKWSRFYMDAAFYTVLNAHSDLSGLKHWNGGRYACK